MHPITKTDSKRMVLGRQADYAPQYDPDQLCPIPRSLGRNAAGIEETPSFAHGQDIWNIYELSWLSLRGKPLVAMAEVRVPWNSPCLIESKSFKLYCNSFNMTALESADALQEMMIRDLSRAAGADVLVRIVPRKCFRGSPWPNRRERVSTIRIFPASLISQTHPCSQPHRRPCAKPSSPACFAPVVR